MHKLYRKLRWVAQDRRELADALLASKLAVYVSTLEDLVTSYGYDLPADGVELSDEVVAALSQEADDSATFIVDTYNEELRVFAGDNAELDDGDFITLYEQWAARRQEHKTEEWSITEAYSAHTDATLSFYRENGLEPEFEFGGHPELGDHPAECRICQTLEETSPHPLSRVLEVGKPHIRCAQNWHALIEPDQLPEELFVGTAVGGVLGQQDLSGRVGGVDAAVDFITGSA